MIKLILILICVKLGHGYSDGAPKSVCTTMTPQHNVAPQQCLPKYIIQSDIHEYNTNGIVRITVRGATNNDHFKGILLVAKNQKDEQIIGTWSVTNSSIKATSCDTTENAAVTHSSSDDKLQIEALWHTPSIISDEKTIIKATIVKSFTEIYVNCFNITLTPRQNNPSHVQPIIATAEKSTFTKANTNVTWNYANEIVTVTMTTEQVDVGEWRGIGFSLDQQMGDEYVFICQVSSTGDVLLRRMHTKLGKRPPSASVEEVNVISTVYENGRATCHFSFETNSEQADGEPAPIGIGKNYYLIFAAGMLRTEEQLLRHNFTFITPKIYQLQNPETINLDEAVLTTPSLMSSTTASLTNDIGVNISWTYAAGITAVKMAINNLKTSQWIALGLSLDDMMGQDHVFICQHLANNTIYLQRFVNRNGHERPVLASTIPNPGGTFSVSRERLENGIAYCDFTLSNFGYMSRHKRQNNVPELSQTTSYRPLIAIGNSDASNTLIRHARTSRTALSQEVLLNRQETIVYNIQPTESDSNGLMKAHGIIMVFTWLVLVSTGILVARYFKRSWPSRKICGKAVWFATHRTIMTSVTVLTLIAFILILVYSKGQWVSKNKKTEFIHSIIGILVISFSVVQPFMALFRCNPDDRNRFIFNYAHAIVGLSAFILSIAAIFLAMFFTQFDFRSNKEWAIIVAWPCWLAVIFVAFEIIEIYFRKHSSSAEKNDAYDMNDRHVNGTTKSDKIQLTETSNNSRIKGLLLLLHVIVACGLALALMIVIGQS